MVVNQALEMIERSQIPVINVMEKIVWMNSRDKVVGLHVMKMVLGINVTNKAVGMNSRNKVAGLNSGDKSLYLNLLNQVLEVKREGGKQNIGLMNAFKCALQVEY